MQKIFHGNCLDVLKTLDDNSIDCCVTSPPYWGLRDYGNEDQLGLESLPEKFVENLVSVFREVKRVLKKEGTLWLNLGDTYFGGRNSCGSSKTLSKKQASSKGAIGQISGKIKFNHEILKPKDLVGIPWRVAFALQADGWYLRQDIIWHKPNPMPESVRDRCTKAHEYIFLLSKSPKYYFDSQSIKEPAVSAGQRRGGGKKYSRNAFVANRTDAQRLDRYGTTPSSRNRRSVWTVSNKPFKGAHFATFPPDLIEPCILAGAPQDGIVLDPFMGSGTTGMVAKKHNRSFIGIELNAEYIEIAKKRIGIE